MTTFLRRLQFLGIAAIAAGTVHVLCSQHSLSAHHRGRCFEFVGGPSPMFACADRHSYQLRGRDWVDAGLMTPGPEVPQN